MNNLKKGYLLSALLHILILFPILFGDKILPDDQQAPTLDLGFSFHLKPLGNSLEKKTVRLRDQKREVIRKNQSNAEGLSEDPQPQSKEQRYGVADGSEGVDEFYVSENYRTIMGQIGNRLLYPEVARSMGWQGRVLITFIITTRGEITKIRIKQSSGYALLDSSAVRTIQSIRGIPAPTAPTLITVPIMFRLN